MLAISPQFAAAALPAVSGGMHSPVPTSAPFPSYPSPIIPSTGGPGYKKNNPWLIWLVVTMIVAVIGGIAAIAIPAILVYGPHPFQQGSSPAQSSVTGNGSESSPFHLSITATGPQLVTMPLLPENDGASPTTIPPQLTLVSLQVHGKQMIITISATHITDSFTLKDFDLEDESIDLSTKHLPSPKFLQRYRQRIH